MSEAKFTKGNWNFNQEIEVDDSLVIVDDDHKVITYLDSDAVFDGSGYFNKMTDEQEANAHLIAAAPEMYETIIAMIEQFDNEEDCINEIDYLVIRTAKEVLAKARGEL